MIEHTKWPSCPISGAVENTSSFSFECASFLISFLCRVIDGQMLRITLELPTVGYLFCLACLMRDFS